PSGGAISACRLIVGEVEAEERHVRLHGAAEDGMLLLGLEVERRPLLRFRRIEDRSRVATQEVTAKQEHDSVLLSNADIRRISAQWPVWRPLGNRVDVSGSNTTGRNRAARIPEAIEVGAALVGGEPVPEQLTGHLVVEAHHVGLDEPLVGHY